MISGSTPKIVGVLAVEVLDDIDADEIGDAVLGIIPIALTGSVRRNNAIQSANFGVHCFMVMMVFPELNR